MSTILISLTEKEFKEYVDPYLMKAKRGFVCSIALSKVFNYILYRLHTGCQWDQLPIDQHPQHPERKEISWYAVYYHYRKWSRDGSLKRVWQNSIAEARPFLDVSELNLDGSHSLAKKGGESVAYQGRKKAKTSNILPVFDKNGYVLATTGIVAGNHNDAFNLKPHLQAALHWIKAQGLSIRGAFFNADSAFDTQDSRKVLFNYGLQPNIPENKRNRKTAKPGPKRLFNQEVYARRFTAERSFAWIDKFRALLVRYDRRDIFFLSAHFIAFAMINLRNLTIPESFN
jgi:transposase